LTLIAGGDHNDDPVFNSGIDGFFHGFACFANLRKANEAHVCNLDFVVVGYDPIEASSDPRRVGLIMTIDDLDRPQSGSRRYSDHKGSVVTRGGRAGDVRSMTAGIGTTAFDFSAFFFSFFEFFYFYIFFYYFAFFFFFNRGYAGVGPHDFEIGMRGIDAGIDYRYVRGDGYVVDCVDRKAGVGESEDSFDSRRSRLRLAFSRGIESDIPNLGILAKHCDGRLGKSGRVAFEGVAVYETDAPPVGGDLRMSHRGGIANRVLEDDDVAAGGSGVVSRRRRPTRSRKQGEAARQGRETDERADANG